MQGPRNENALAANVVVVVVVCRNEGTVARNGSENDGGERAPPRGYERRLTSRRVLLTIAHERGWPRQKQDVTTAATTLRLLLLLFTHHSTYIFHLLLVLLVERPDNIPYDQNHVRLGRRWFVWRFTRRQERGIQANDDRRCGGGPARAKGGRRGGACQTPADGGGGGASTRRQET